MRVLQESIMLIRKGNRSRSITADAGSTHTFTSASTVHRITTIVDTTINTAATPNTTINPNPQPINPIPARSQINQPFDPSPVIQNIPEPVVNPVPSSPLAPSHNDIPESPASPSFVTPPSSPVQLPDIPEASCPTPNPVPQVQPH